MTLRPEFKQHAAQFLEVWREINLALSYRTYAVQILLSGNACHEGWIQTMREPWKTARFSNILASGKERMKGIPNLETDLWK